MSIIRWDFYDDALRRMHVADGQGVPQIAERTGLAPQTVRKRLKAMGTYRDGANATLPPPTFRNGWTPEREAIFRRMVAEKATTRQIAAACGTDTQSIYRKLEALRDREAVAERDQSSATIVDAAHRILRTEGYSEKRLSVMTLDQRMRTANGFLFKLGRKQLGKKDDWLWK